MAVQLGYTFTHTGAAVAWQSFSPSTGSDSVTKMFGSDTMVQNGTGFALAPNDYVFSGYRTTTLTIQDGGVKASHTLGGSSDMLELWVREQAGGSAYICRIEAGASTLWYYDGSSYTTIGTGGGYTYTADATQKVGELTAVGSTITVKVNGSAVITVTHTTITAAGKQRASFRSNTGYDIDYVEFADTSSAAPVITGPSGTGSVLTGGGSCSTTGSTGLLWWKADASSTASDPGAGSEAGAGWTSQAVSGSGTQTVASFGALTAGTKYVHYLHVDGSSNRSTVADSSSFTVLAAAANSPRSFRPLFLNL